ncbi:MAG TPA: phage tail protein [Candidatus Binatia bacterium]|jgi:phage tail-like protein
MPASRNDPYGAFNFIVEIDGLTVAGFSECSGLTVETAVIEYREGNEPGRVRKLAGLTKFAPITLKRGLTQNRDLWNWYKNIMNGAADRRNGSIVLLGNDHTPVARWNFTNGWPAKWEGPHLKAKGNEVAIETLEIEHEGLEYE